MMHYYYNLGPERSMDFSWIFMIIFWGLIIWAVISLVKNARKGGDHFGMGLNNKDEDKAISILRERYAKGDINKQEFEEKKADLMNEVKNN